MITRRLLIIFALLAAMVASAFGQNSIDRLVENHSSVGQSKFTSAVERDPKTRKIQRVVKVLELNDADISRFTAAFKREAATGDFTERRTDGGLTLVLTVRGKGQNRVYMMKCDGPYAYNRNTTRYSFTKITVIVKYG